MTIPDYIAFEYGAWRTIVQQGNSLEARVNHRNANAYAVNLAGRIEPTPPINAALQDAVQESQAYFAAQEDIFSKPSNSRALAALDRLAAELAAAKPNDITKALGLA